MRNTILTYPQVTSLRKISSRTYEVDVMTDNVALFVWLSVGDIRGWFSDNGFLMISPNITVTFYAANNVTLNSLMRRLTVTSLSDVYNR